MRTESVKLWEIKDIRTQIIDVFILCTQNAPTYLQLCRYVRLHQLQLKFYSFKKTSRYTNFIGSRICHSYVSVVGDKALSRQVCKSNTEVSLDTVIQWIFVSGICVQFGVLQKTYQCLCLGVKRKLYYTMRTLPVSLFYGIFAISGINIYLCYVGRYAFQRQVLCDGHSQHSPSRLEVKHRNYRIISKSHQEISMSYEHALHAECRDNHMMLRNSKNIFIANQNLRHKELSMNFQVTQVSTWCIQQGFESQSTK